MSPRKNVTTERKRLAVQLESGFVELSYVVHMPASGRRIVVCLPDFLGNSADFTRLAAMLAGHGMIVVCPDMPGRGESAYLQPAEYNPHTYLVALVSLIATLGSRRINLVGKGWGALLALGLAGMPELSVSRLILADLGFPWKLQVDEAVSAAVRGPAFATLDAARQLLAASSEFEGMTPRRMLPLLDGRLRQSGDGYGLDFDPVLLSEEAIGRFSRMPTGALFAGVKARTLYLTGGALAERERERMREAGFPGPTRSIAENVAPGKRAHFTSAHELLLTLGFLSSRALPSG